MAHDHQPNHELHTEEQVSHTVPSTVQTLTTFAVLAGLALLALYVGFSTELGSMKVVASLAVSTVQACVLAYFFMDLKQADALTWLVAAASIFWTGLMFLFTLTDYLTRHLGVL
jgi:caa(3)-type oxidase subunit IV